MNARLGKEELTTFALELAAAMPPLSEPELNASHRETTTTFAIQRVPLSISSDASLQMLAEDIASLLDVADSLAIIGASGPVVAEENVFHGIRFLTRIARAYAEEIESRTSAINREAAAVIEGAQT